MTGSVSYAGLRLLPGYFDRGQQTALLTDIRRILAAAPLFTPRMPKSGRPFSVQMSNCGVLGWLSDENGYRYAAVHPETGRLWPPLPQRLAALWDEVASYPHPPEACLINFYQPTAKMGLHQDRDETDFSAPVVSVSLGDTCLFRLRAKPRRPDPLLSPQFRRRDRARWGHEARFPWRRSYLSRHIHPAPRRRTGRGRTNQFDAAPSDADTGAANTRVPERPGSHQTAIKFSDAAHRP